jgi:hypothetical protein
MSTPTALPLEPRPWKGSGWRAVEAQHKNATMALAHGRLHDQALLEDIIETAKPLRPPGTDRLHFLLATPFRYRARPPTGSRFRRREDPGVFYGAETERTACAEAGYWRLRFWMDSEGLRQRPASLAMTLFRFHGKTPRGVDLTLPPLAKRRDWWTHPSDYSRTQEFAQHAREAGAVVIRYESVRDAPDGRCLAILSPEVFRAVREPFRNEQQGWSLFLRPPELTVWQRDLDGAGFEFAHSSST